MTMTAILDPDGTTFTMSGGDWSGTYPVSDLPKWLRFYRRQMERFPDHAGVYAESVRALERLAEDARATGEGNPD